jgi:mechanosensitive ion channel-like protein
MLAASVTAASSAGDEISGLVGSAVTIALKVLVFLAIMALGWFVGTLLYTWLLRLLRRIGFDRAVQRGGLARMLGRYTASDLTARLIDLGFLLFVLQVAFGVFGPNPASDLIRSFVAWIPKLVVAIVIVVVAAALAGWVREVISQSLADVAYGRGVATGVQVVLLVLGIMAALSQIGIGTTVTLPVLVAVLATAGGILIVGVGGGLIKPMQHRWERMLNRAETEAALASERVRTNRSDRTGRADAGATQPSRSPRS